MSAIASNMQLSGGRLINDGVQYVRVSIPASGNTIAWTATFDGIIRLCSSTGKCAIDYVDVRNNQSYNLGSVNTGRFYIGGFTSSESVILGANLDSSNYATFITLVCIKDDYISVRNSDSQSQTVNFSIHKFVYG